MLVRVRIPPEPFNSLVRNHQSGDLLKRILDDLKPEAVYFTEMDGCRGAILVVDVHDPSSVPAICEPWFLSFNAEVQFHIVMSPEDLGRSGLDQLGKKWSHQ